MCRGYVGEVPRVGYTVVSISAAISGLEAIAREPWSAKPLPSYCAAVGIAR